MLLYCIALTALQRALSAHTVVHIFCLWALDNNNSSYRAMTAFDISQLKRLPTTHFLTWILQVTRQPVTIRQNKKPEWLKSNHMKYDIHSIVAAYSFKDNRPAVRIPYIIWRIKVIICSFGEVSNRGYVRAVPVFAVAAVLSVSCPCCCL